MIGFMISGHGHFATGLLSAVEMIAGKQEKMAAIDFLSGDSSESLREKMVRSIRDFACESMVLLTDLSGGTPFQQKVQLYTQQQRACAAQKSGGI